MATKKVDLSKLKKEIPYKWRVQSFSKFKPQATCVAYIDARDAMCLLDEVVGPENWQDDYREMPSGKLVAGVGIKCGSEWVWKWDTGTESNMEAEKGQMSDAFKRACVKWGIGRFLYSLGMKYIKANEVKKGNNYPYCVDDKGNRVYDLTEYFSAPPKPQKKNAPQTTKTAPKKDDIAPDKNDVAPPSDLYLHLKTSLEECGSDPECLQRWVELQKEELDSLPPMEKQALRDLYKEKI